MGLTNMAAGNPAPESKARTSTVRNSLSDYRGKVVLIDFGAIGEGLAGPCPHERSLVKNWKAVRL